MVKGNLLLALPFTVALLKAHAKQATNAVGLTSGT